MRAVIRKFDFSIFREDDHSVSGVKSFAFGWKREIGRKFGKRITNPHAS